MPHQRKVRTRSTRFQVAAEAARIIATEGQQDYHTAKRKAADRIGISDRLALPSNQEVQDALLSYQALYGGQQHSRNLEKLRLAAIEAMRKLAAYSPAWSARCWMVLLAVMPGLHCMFSATNQKPWYTIFCKKACHSGRSRNDYDSRKRTTSLSRYSCWRTAGIPLNYSCSTRSACARHRLVP